MELCIEAEEKRAFRYVRFFDTRSAIRGYFPDFLVVGPQRTGTTWLSENLRLHPEVFVSYPKELHFFNRLRWPGHAPRLHPPRWTGSVRSYAREWARSLYVDALKTGRYRVGQLEWFLCFFEIGFASRTWRRWQMQRRYGEYREPKVRGEATATYAVLDSAIIEEIVRLNPDLKVILMIRDPVERAWSHAKKDLLRARNLRVDQVSEEAFFDFFREPYQLRCGQFTRQIACWSNALAKGNLYLGEFHRIQTSPRDLLTEIHAFLGVDTDAKFQGASRVGRVFNETGAERIPEVYRAFLEDLFAEEKRRLRELLRRAP